MTIQSAESHGLSPANHQHQLMKKWFDSWISSKDEQFFRRGIHSLPERWSKVVESDGKYFNVFFNVHVK